MEKRQGRTDKLMLLGGVYVAGMMIANFSGVKLVQIGPASISIGTFMIALTFLCTDIMSDVWGIDASKQMIKIGIITNVMAVVFMQIAIRAPYVDFWMDQEAYATIFGGQARLVLAGLVSYVFSQTVDLHVFQSIKERTGEDHLWIRNNASTMISQAVDTIIFTTLAFGGVVPLSGWLGLMGGQYVIRVIMSLLDTPLCYLGVKWARK